MTARTVSREWLEARVPDATDIELPGPEGGWAVAVINGGSYRARVGAVACRTCRSLHGPHEPCVQRVQDCAEETP